MKIVESHRAVLLPTGCVCTGKPSAGKLGKFLVQAQFQGSVHSSALFLTAAAQNLLCMKLAAELGVNIPSPWVTWFKGAAVPALLGLLITPLIMFKVGSRTSSLPDLVISFPSMPFGFIPHSD